MESIVKLTPSCFKHKKEMDEYNIKLENLHEVFRIGTIADYITCVLFLGTELSFGITCLTVFLISPQHPALVQTLWMTLYIQPFMYLIYYLLYIGYFSKKLYVFDNAIVLSNYSGLTLKIKVGNIDWSVEASYFPSYITMLKFGWSAPIYVLSNQDLVLATLQKYSRENASTNQHLGVAANAEEVA